LYIKIGNWWFAIIGLIIILYIFRRKFLRLKKSPMPMKKKSSKI